MKDKVWKEKKKKQGRAAHTNSEIPGSFSRGGKKT